MNAALAGFWLRRFATVAGCCGAGLLALQWLQRRTTSADYLDTLLWSLLAGLLVASFNTWWAWRHGCRLR